MKTKKLTIAIAIVAMTFIGTSCGNKQQKSASEATTEQSASSALEIDSLLANAENLAGQEVTIEGVCTHTCKHGAKKIFLMGSDDTQVIRVEAGTLGAFDPKCVNSIVRNIERTTHRRSLPPKLGSTTQSTSCRKTRNR